MNNTLIASQSSFSISIYKKLVASLLKSIQYGCITIEDPEEVLTYGIPNHKLQAQLYVKDFSFYKDLFWSGDLGFAESYIHGDWETENLRSLLRILTLNLTMVAKADNSTSGILLRLISKIIHFINKNNITGSKRNIAKHYDLGNDFFKLFLDPTMMYSSAIFENYDSTLEQASMHKLKTICDKLELKPTDHLLEIGTGWGGLAIYAAQNYGCKITTTTISQEQYDYVINKITNLGLLNNITILKHDYRELTGIYDKVVSIEMIEAVGDQYFATYFAQCSKLVKSNGLFLLQAITIAEQRYNSARDSVDFIKKHIFPGCCIPSLAVIMKNIQQHTNYNMLNMQDISLDYAKTLNHWHKAFSHQVNTIKSQGFDTEFIRKWQYYFSYCEAGFLERAIFDFQIVFSKPEYRSKEYASL